MARVQVYAVEIGKEMGLEGVELESLRAAALLHDIGKLAIPEHIRSKPGKLTVDELAQMKTHAVVGAGMLSRMQFPDSVTRIVVAHHEKWNGTGYPYSVKGSDIPRAARILSAVDCLDALTSDRHYRRALSLDQAMALVAGESGQAYDPDVVATLVRRYRALETPGKFHGRTPLRLGHAAGR